MDEEFEPENMLYNIQVMQEKDFGDKKRWKKILKKLEKKQSLDQDDYDYYKMIGNEYSAALRNKRKWQKEQIENLQQIGIGENERWESIKRKLNNGKNLTGVDLEYYHAKFREYEHGIITSTFNVQGREIVAYLGIVSGQAVIGLMFLKDMVMGLSDVFGGRSGIMERNFRTAKEIAIKQMADEAKDMGANAVVGVSISFNPIEGKNKQMLMVVASGTAVITRARPKDDP